MPRTGPAAGRQRPLARIERRLLLATAVPEPYSGQGGRRPVDLTSDQTSQASSTPVRTTDQTCRLLRQRCPDRPHHFSRAYMCQHTAPVLNCSNQKNRYGRCGQCGQCSNGTGSGRPDLALMVWTVRTAGMFHANHRAIGRPGGAGGRAGGRGQADGSSPASDSTGIRSRNFSLVMKHFQGGCSGF